MDDDDAPVTRAELRQALRDAARTSDRLPLYLVLLGAVLAGPAITLLLADQDPDRLDGVLSMAIIAVLLGLGWECWRRWRD